MNELTLGYNSDLIEYDVKKEVKWFIHQSPHVVIIGSTGSGKTYFSKYLLGKIAISLSDTELIICDFKGDDDFSFLTNCSSFYRFDDCSIGFDQFFTNFRKRQSGENKTRHHQILFFDEWASYCNSLDKKIVEEEKKKLATLLMLGRSFNVHVIISQQRADASYFSSARDNFNLVVGLGNLSEESKNMLFHEYKDIIKPDRKQGTGYIIQNGCNFEPIIVPTVNNFKKLNNCIRKLVDYNQ
ncbi:type IV secretory system conjugative DNA transfer family protein [Fusibacter bizertensis]|uniref:Type IV secretory system conjugative DNA transfer family protein n=1 Tax=Fusibacter bizertensis TaxID=1488331 RepID=A0ABT6NDZ5_9FIRM|nr:type IV secretory system conjugative DNA transfer family protein [Fusibacter bizertensis]MDH8678653.1 type IV secretory system conjugative DNA transfer family protein [Fusibacter bizertensis]